MFSASKTAGPSGYNISRSVRLRSSASAYLNRTYSVSPTSNKICTVSFWIKRGKLGAQQAIIGGYDGTSANLTRLEFSSSDQLNFQFGGATANALTTNAVYRDPSAWYHVVLAVDTTQATSSNRYLLYVNGVQVTSFATANYAAQNSTFQFVYANANNTIAAQSSTIYLDSYLTEINFIDGQALTPSSFGSTNAITGVWQPAKYTGTYGTNGFYLNFSDNSAATAAAIGKDYSGNGNNWTPNNISVTAGVTYDSMIDVPTPYADGSTGRGNYAVLNPLVKRWSVASETFSNANLTVTNSGASNDYALGTTFVDSGQYYWEVTATTVSGVFAIGVDNGQLQNSVSTNAVFYNNDGTKSVAGTGSAYGATYTSGDVIGVALDKNANTVTFYKNNTSQGSINLPVTTVSMGAAISPGTSGGVANFNFGQRPFSYTPPSGYKALNTYNLPASTITNGGKYMAATLYTGTLLSNSITNAGGFKPDLVWVKSRSAATDHKLTDSVRGVTKALISDTTGAETTDTQGLTAFNSNGFTVGTDTNYNNLSATYVGWQWQAGQGSTSSNTSGTITSTVSVNATAGFSVVTFTIPSTNLANTIGHGLGVAPAMYIVKERSTTSSWFVYHQSLGATKTVTLNTTNASDTNQKYWNNTAPTSSVFSLGQAGVAWWDNNATAVAYCWAEIAGFSKFGSYTGNGSTDGPFVFTGHRPRFVLIKITSAAGSNWFIHDTARSTYNQSQLALLPNDPSAEINNALYAIDVLSNGFKLRTTDAQLNSSGATYIYAAFAENPFANALAR